MLLSLLPAVAFGVLTYSCAIAIYNAQQDPHELFFVISTYALVLLLFLTIHALEKTPAARGGERGLLVMAVWVESVLLNLSFTGRVVEILPPSMSLPVWLSSCLVAALGFCLCFGFG